MLIDFTAIEASQRYKLMSETIIPRPIAWIVTQEGDTVNIAPFSFFNGVSSNPPTVMVSIGHKSDGTPKDTLAHLRSSQKCVICTVVPEHLQPMHATSESLHVSISEAEHFDIATEAVYEDFPPIISGVPSAFFCTLLQEVALEGSKTIPLFLKIEKMYLSDAHHKEGVFELELLGRTGKHYQAPGVKITAP